jgi:hypothetical protein
MVKNTKLLMTFPVTTTSHTLAEYASAVAMPRWTRRCAK